MSKKKRIPNTSVAPDRVVRPPTGGVDSLPTLRALVPPVVLALVVLACFQITLGFPLLSFGDNATISANPVVTGGLSGTGVGHVMWDQAAGYWKPAAWMSHMLDTELGASAEVRRATNLILHLLSSMLLFVFLKLATGAPGRSLAVAAFFALHPLRVQSVAWVAERQGLLAGFFSFLTLAAWAWWRRGGGARWAWAVALGACVLAMASSPAAVVLPLVLLLFEFWPLGGGGAAAPRWREHAPFAAASVAAFAVWWARFSDLAPATAPWRVEASPWPALFNTVWPVNLTPIAGVAVPAYGEPAGWTVMAVAAGLMVIYAARFRYIVTGLGWFLLALLAGVAMSEPGWHSYADRFTYFAHAGLGVTLVWAGYEVLGRRALYLAAPLAVLMVYQTREQLGYWRSDTALVERAAALNPGNANVASLLGHSFLERNEFDKAVGAFRRAASLNSKSAEFHQQLGGALQAAGQLAEALAEIDLALRPDPNLGSAYVHRGSILVAMDRRDEAAEPFRRALAAGLAPPLRLATQFNLGLLEARAGRFAAALDYFSQVLAVDPNHYPARKNVALVYLRQQRWDEARAALERLGPAAGRQDAEVRDALRILSEHR